MPEPDIINHNDTCKHAIGDAQATKRAQHVRSNEICQEHGIIASFQTKQKQIQLDVPTTRFLQTKNSEQTDSFISQRHGRKEIVHYYQYYTVETNKQKNRKSEGQEASTNKHQHEPSFFL